jgi:hypothetical protein
MELCSRQCLRRTLHGVLIGISPIVICIFLIIIARFILHCLELIYNRRQKPIERRRSSTTFYHSGRPTLSYTPVSIEELQRIIHGDYHSRQQRESFFYHNHDSPKASHFMKSILTRRESSPAVSSNTFASLVVRRNALTSAPYTALFAPVSSTPTFDVINEQTTRRASIMTIKHESIERTTLSTTNNSNNSIFYNTNDSWECESTETDPLVTLTKTTSTTTVVVEEFLDFHSVHSVPYSLNLGNSVEADRF